MARCLDEAILQSYFDGELSTQLMESATSHLASCGTCAAAARELEEENVLLASALAAEFEASVPTERLRRRIDTAVLGARVASAAANKKGGVAAFFNSVAGLFSFGSQRTLGYASLVVVMAFAAIIGVVKMKQSQAPADVDESQSMATATSTTEVSPIPVPPITNGAVTLVAENTGPNVKSGPQMMSVKTRRPAAAPKPVPVSSPVRLIPGERSYLQTIARLDSTIKSGNKAMRPSLRVEYERNLAVVDRAIAATRSAAKSNPNDTDAADFMFAAYQSKVDLLNTIADARLGGGRSH